MEAKKVTFEVQYEAGHSYSETWMMTSLYCPHCGKQAVWDRDGAGDYYVGTALTCADCAGTFHLPCEGYAEQNWQVRQRLAAFKAAS